MHSRAVFFLVAIRVPTAEDAHVHIHRALSKDAAAREAPSNTANAVDTTNCSTPQHLQVHRQPAQAVLAASATALRSSGMRSFVRAENLGPQRQSGRDRGLGRRDESAHEVAAGGTVEQEDQGRGRGFPKGLSFAKQAVMLAAQVDRLHR